MSQEDRRTDPYYPQLEITYDPLGPSAYPELPPETEDFLRRLKGRRVLEIAAGEGRATTILLEEGNSVIASDYDIAALRSLRGRIPQAHNLSVVAFDAVDNIPLPNQCVDSIVSINFFYVYPPEVLKERVYPEIARLLRAGGNTYFDFITEVRREKPSGETVPFHVNYTFASGMETVHALADYGFEIATTAFLIDQPPTQKVDYRLTGKAILVRATKS